MALIQTSARNELLSVGDPYVAEATKKAIPKYTIPEDYCDPAIAYQLVHDELMMDGNARLNLATFCQTWLDESIHKLMDECVDKNMIDKDLYPQTAEIEKRCVHILANLWRSPDDADSIGCSTIGSSEAAFLGGLALKWTWKKKRGDKPSDKPNIIFGAVQVCWHKFARYFDVEMREVPMEPANGKYVMTGKDVAKLVDENTIGVVVTLGLTFVLQYEPVIEISKALDLIKNTKGWDIPIHVDAAGGGFVAPFVTPNLGWDFRLERVRSINASGHKYGLSPLGVGWIVWRSQADLPDYLKFEVDYLGGKMINFSLNFSRPGGQIVAQYYNLIRHGRKGFRLIHEACLEHSSYIAKELRDLKDKDTDQAIFKIIYPGVSEDGVSKDGLPGVCWALNSSTQCWSLKDLEKTMRATGWKIATYPLPVEKGKPTETVQRVLIRHGFSHDMAELLLKDLIASIAELTQPSKQTPNEAHIAC